MNSMLEDVLAREGSAPAFEDSRVDAELEEMLSKMRTNIKIIGLGGGGCNTIGRVYNEGIVGAELYACNTDAQHLLHIASPKKVLLGRRITKGLGAGALPQIGEEAAREAEEELRAIVQGADIVFVTCGLGGGTGTGSCGYVARLAKEMGALTIAVVTLPFRGEGKLRMESAEWGLERLRDAADTVITIPNDKLLDLVPRQSLNLAFKFADEVLMRSIKGLTEIITKPGLVNLDFNDVKTIMKGGGVAMIGLGESQAVGDNRAVEAIEEAINSPLLEVDVSTARRADQRHGRERHDDLRSGTRRRGRPIEGVPHRADHLGRDGRSVARTHASRDARRDRRQIETDCRATRPIGGEGARRR